MVYLSFAWRLSFIKHRRKFMPTTQGDYAGKYLKDYEPHTTIHSVVNRMLAWVNQ